MRILVIGGGIFGCCIATELARDGHRVTLVERNDEIMQEASRCNHNRLHLGYHYPRSVITAKQSIEGLLSFFMYFGRALITEFPNYYAIAKHHSKTSVHDFTTFCDEVGISYREGCPGEEFLNCEKVTGCFLVREPIFDYTMLQQIVCERMDAAGVDVRLGRDVGLLGSGPDGRYNWSGCNGPGGESYDYVINAAYSGLNAINSMLGLPELPVLYEDVSIPIFEYDASPIAVTVMDGPFCTVMPCGGRPNHFLLYHVLHSVHARWDHGGSVIVPKEALVRRDTRDIYDASALYMPFVGRGAHRDAYRTIRVVTDNNSDARLTDVFLYPTCPNYISVLSGKISTAMRTAIQVRQIVAGDPNAGRYVI